MGRRRVGAVAAVLLLGVAALACGQQPTPEAGGPSPAADPGVTLGTTGTMQPTDPGLASNGPSAAPSGGTTGPPACTTIGQRWTSPADDVELVCVPAGSFEMGTAADDPNARPETTPRHLVRLSAFWIDRTEVTNAAFATCVALGACRARPDDPGATGVASKTRLGYYRDPAFADYPVLIYTADEAAAYCACMGRRLPTEAEFEHAAGGPDDPHAYPWGDLLDCDHASYLGCTTDTTEVTSPAAGASAFGALDMAGNVWEWVSDLYAEDYYGRSTVDDPTGPATGDWHVRRGGGFSSLPRHLLVTTRASGNPAHYFDGQMGFRCAADGGGGSGTTP